MDRCGIIFLVKPPLVFLLNGHLGVNVISLQPSHTFYAHFPLELYFQLQIFYFSKPFSHTSCHFGSSDR